MYSYLPQAEQHPRVKPCGQAFAGAAGMGVAIQANPNAVAIERDPKGKPGL